MIEEAWLGRLSPPFRELCERGEWRPDALGAACPRCAKAVGPLEAVGYEGDSFGCPRCREEALPWTRAIRLGTFDGILRDAIHDTKFTAFRHTGETLGELLALQLKPILDEAGLTPSRARLVPVPMSLRRRLSRGIHHTLTIARGVRRVLGIPILEGLARRHGPSQLEVPAGARGANIKGRMRWRGGMPENIRVIILIDDVLTTGATMREACRALRKGTAEQKRSNTPNGDTVREGTARNEIWIAACGVAEEYPAKHQATGTLERS